MNDIEVIQWLATANAKACRPRRKEEIDLSLPYFEVFKNVTTNRYDIRGYNFENHDNLPRMYLWELYMRHKILPHIKSNVTGYYNIELHDSYTYLDAPRQKYDGCFTFSKFKDDPGPVLIPDPYAMQNWGGKLNALSDSTPWKDKLDKVCFYGTTTGNRIPSLNERINMCLWSLKKPALYDFKITQVAQMREEDVRYYLGAAADSILASPVPIEHQMKYKYHLMMDGNTCRFDIWNFFTNSVTLKHESKEMLWYYPLLLEGVHYIEVNQNTIEDYVGRLTPTEAEFIIANAQRTVKKIANPLTHMLYLTALFESIGEQRA